MAAEVLEITEIAIGRQLAIETQLLQSVSRPNSPIFISKRLHLITQHAHQTRHLVGSHDLKLNYFTRN